MIRAAAKNYLLVAALVDPADYGPLVEFLAAHAGQLDLSKRFELAGKAFAHTARYDGLITGFLARQDANQVAATYTPVN